MVDHYLDLRLRPDPEFASPDLLNALAGKLHRALVALRSQDVGVSFPHHRNGAPGLGDILRLHASGPRLQQLMQADWLTGMADHVAATGVQPVPPGAQHRVVRRVQAHSNPERLRRRQIKRHGWTEAEARERIPDAVAQRLNLPYLTLRSQSTGQSFRLFVEHLPCQNDPQTGSFSSYGLSTDATVPWF